MKRRRPCRERIPRIFHHGNLAHDTTRDNVILGETFPVFEFQTSDSVPEWWEMDRETERGNSRKQRKNSGDEAASDSSNWNTGLDTHWPGIFCWDSADFWRIPFRPEYRVTWALKFVSYFADTEQSYRREMFALNISFPFSYSL